MSHRVVLERSHHRLHLSERRSVESKREITGLVLCKAERPTACHSQARSSDVNTFSRQSSAIRAGDDGYRVDRHAANHGRVEEEPQRAVPRHAAEQHIRVEAAVEIGLGHPRIDCGEIHTAQIAMELMDGQMFAHTHLAGERDVANRAAEPRVESQRVHADGE